MKADHFALMEAFGHIETEPLPPTAPFNPHGERPAPAGLPKGISVSDEPREIGWGQEYEIENGADLFHAPTAAPAPPTAEERTEIEREHGSLLVEDFGPSKIEATPASEEAKGAGAEAQRFLSELFSGDDQ